MTTETKIRLPGFAVFSLLIASLCGTSAAQSPYDQHHLTRSNMPPGLAADAYRLAHPELNHHIQTVQVSVPQGAVVHAHANGGFTASADDRLSVGMAIGPVYRFKVSRIPRLDTTELYPSIELLGKLNPPPGLENRFPVEIHVTQDDLEQAAQGRMVTKVIYLENPKIALPHRHAENHQPAFDVGGRQDPLRAAERLGRPLAILRVGSRIPSNSADDSSFMFQGQSPEVLGEPNGKIRCPHSGFPGETEGNAAKIAPGRVDSHSNIKTVGHHQELATVNYSGFERRTSTIVRPPVVPRQHLENGEKCFDPERRINPWNPQAEPDEYVFDGDDQGKPVAVDRQWKVTGLNIEDTVGHFDTLDGRRLVSPSNRVAIYAPRFAAVRRVDGLIKAESRTRAGAFEEKTMLAHSKSANSSSSMKQNLPVDRFGGSKRASGLINRNRGVVHENVTHLFGVRNHFKGFENLSLIKFGKHSNSQSSRLAMGMQSANVWEDDLGLQVVVDQVEPVIVNDVYRVQQLVAIDIDEESAVLRVVKLASKIAARPGEEVEFTIRFDNLTGRKIGNVTLIDNLTRRLEYVPDSAECSLKSNFISSENEAGSLMLRWEVTDPMPANSGGILRFRCRVR